MSTRLPYGITTGPGGALWFTEWGGQLPRTDSPTGTGIVTEFDLPTTASEPHGIAVGPDGALWAALKTGAAARIAP